MSTQALEEAALRTMGLEPGALPVTPSKSRRKDLLQEPKFANTHKSARRRSELLQLMSGKSGKARKEPGRITTGVLASPDGRNLILGFFDISLNTNH